MEYPRPPAETARSMRVKDAMREGPVRVLAAQWGQLAAGCAAAGDCETAAMVLETAARYVDWVSRWDGGVGRRLGSKAA